MSSVIRLTIGEFNFCVAARVSTERILQLNSGENNIYIYIYTYTYNNTRTNTRWHAQTDRQTHSHFLGCDYAAKDCTQKLQCIPNKKTILPKWEPDRSGTL